MKSYANCGDNNQSCKQDLNSLKTTDIRGLFVFKSSQVKSSFFRQAGPIRHRLVSKGALCKIKST